MLRTAVLAVFAAAPLAAMAVPAFRSRMDSLSSSYDESVSDVHVYVVHRQTSTRHASHPMPLEYPRYNNEESTLSRLRAEELSSRSLLTGTSLLNSKLDRLCAYRDGLHSSSSILRGLAAMSTDHARAAQPQFSQQCASELLNFQQALGAYQGLLGELCLESALANMVRHVELESTLDDIVVSVRSVLGDVNTILVNAPSVSANVGPIVYGIGGTVNELVSNIESNRDSGLLAALHVDLGRHTPQLSPLAAVAGETACGCAVPALAGVCH